MVDHEYRMGIGSIVEMMETNMRNRNVVILSLLAIALGACSRSPQSDAANASAKVPVGAVQVLRPLAATNLPLMVVTKNATCGCCRDWVERMRAAGFRVEVHDVDNLDPIRTRVGVPVGKGACHTGEIGGYFIEGHVPAADIKRLLAEKPAAKGLVLPGMPMGSPGMELPDGSTQPYAVDLVENDGHTEVFARHDR